MQEPTWGPGLKARHVSWPGIEPATFSLAGTTSKQLSRTDQGPFKSFIRETYSLQPFFQIYGELDPLIIRGTIPGNRAASNLRKNNIFISA